MSRPKNDVERGKYDSKQLQMHDPDLASESRVPSQHARPGSAGHAAMFGGGVAGQEDANRIAVVRCAPLKRLLRAPGFPAQQWPLIGLAFTLDHLFSSLDSL